MRIPLKKTLLLNCILVASATCDEYRTTIPTVERDADGKETWRFRHRNTGEVLFEGGDRVQAIVANKSLLTHVDLSLESMVGIDLSGTNMSSAYLYKANLSGASLQHCKFSMADLGDADLSGADLSASYFGRSDLEGASLHGANLANASVYHSNLRSCDLSDANLSFTTLCESDFTGSDLRGASFRKAKFIKIIFEPSFIPEPENLLGATGLRSLEVKNNYEPIERLRNSAYDRGFRDVGAELTCSIQRSKNKSPDTSTLVRALNFYLFDATCAYGASPKRALHILAFLSPFYFLIVIWNVDTERRNGRIKIAYRGKNGRMQVVGVARFLKLGESFKSFQQYGKFLLFCLIGAILLVFNVLLGFSLTERFISTFSPRPFHLRAFGILGGWVYAFTASCLFLVVLWAGSRFGRLFG